MMWWIGMNESSEFAGELFDALARRRGIVSASVTKEELREFWEQITDQSFDSRLQTFFDMWVFIYFLLPGFYILIYQKLSIFDSFIIILAISSFSNFLSWLVNHLVIENKAKNKAGMWFISMQRDVRN